MKKVFSISVFFHSIFNFNVGCLCCHLPTYQLQFFLLFAKKIGLNVTETGIVISALTLGALIGGPIWGKFVDRTGKGKLPFSSV